MAMHVTVIHWIPPAVYKCVVHGSVRIITNTAIIPTQCIKESHRRISICIVI